MCGKFYADDDLEEEIRKTIRKIDRDMSQQRQTDAILAAGERKPTDRALTISARDGKIILDTKRFGMTASVLGERAEGSLVINARSETVLQKPLFSHAFEKHRTVIPASGFYEWNAQKEKSRFTGKDRKVLYFAGCFQKELEMDQFVIITTAANASMEPVHNRMPLILEENEVAEWLFSTDRARCLLRKVPADLQRESEYEQMSLFG